MCIRKDGSRFWAKVVITPIYDSRGIHVGFSKITRDLRNRPSRGRNAQLLHVVARPALHHRSGWIFQTPQ